MFQRTEALEVAEQLARGLSSCTTPRMARLDEFLVFGSTSKERRAHVNDLDILALFNFGGEARLKAALILEELDGLKLDFSVSIPIDFTLVHSGYFWDDLIRHYYNASFVRGFFENAFASFLQWNGKSGCFEKKEKKYLIEKYSSPPSLIERERMRQALSWPGAEIELKDNRFY
jgi:hypothetical protein